MIKFYINNTECFLSEEDSYLLQYKMFLDKDGYVMLVINKTMNKLARLITNCPKNMQVDHIDKNRCNNLRENLRICTGSQNHANKGKSMNKYRKLTSKYKGVGKKGNKWRARIKINGKEIHLGEFNTEDEAAKAYDAKAKELFKEFANLNFK